MFPSHIDVNFYFKRGFERQIPLSEIRGEIIIYMERRQRRELPGDFVSWTKVSLLRNVVNKNLYLEENLEQNLLKNAVLSEIKAKIRKQ